MNRAPDIAGTARAPETNASSRGISRVTLWTGIGFGAAVCLAVLLMWGIYGPSYLLDLIAAYCF